LEFLEDWIFWLINFAIALLPSIIRFIQHKITKSKDSTGKDASSPSIVPNYQKLLDAAVEEGATGDIRKAREIVKLAKLINDFTKEIEGRGSRPTK